LYWRERAKGSPSPCKPVPFQCETKKKEGEREGGRKEKNVFKPINPPKLKYFSLIEFYLLDMIF
jgi:hypothetical protein